MIDIYPFILCLLIKSNVPNGRCGRSEWGEPIFSK